MGDSIIGTVVEDAVALATNPVGGLIKIATDVLPSVADWIFGDGTGDKVAGIVKAVAGTDDPEKAAAALGDPNLRFQLQMALAKFADDEKNRQHEERMAQISAATEEMRSVLGDVADARKRDSLFITNNKPNWRANILLGLAFFAVISVYFVCAFFGADKIGAMVVGSMLTTAGLFAQKIGTAFDFEFGSSRGQLDAQNLLAQAGPITPVK